MATPTRVATTESVIETPRRRDFETRRRGSGATLERMGARQRLRNRLHGAGHLLLVPALLAVALSCSSDGGSHQGSSTEGPPRGDIGPSDGSAPDPSTGTTERSPSGADEGPRALPPTFVELEVERFPRPADEACDDNSNLLEVTQGESIADALREAPSGSTLVVEPGSYVEENDGDFRALVFETSNVCLRAKDGGEVVVEAGEGQNIGAEITVDDVVVEGVVLRGFRTGVSLTTAPGLTIRGVTLERLRVERGPGAFNEGIISFGDNHEVSVGEDHAGGDAPTVDGLLLRDVEVTGTDLGISCNFGPCEHWWLERVSVTGRRGAEGSGADTFAIEDGRQIVVVDSEFSGAAADGIDTKAADVVVFGVRVTDVARNAIKLWEGGDVINTIVDGSGADAALIGEQAARYRYLHVLVTHHGRGADPYVGAWGFIPGDPVTLEIVNSIFYENSPGGFWVSEGSDVSIRNTILDDPDAKLFDVGSGGTYMVSDLSTLEGLGWTSRVMIADPLFVSSERGDFTTGTDSPARDAAEEVDGLDRDITGGRRSQGRGPDIGPYESG